ncbi:FUSC family protein [Erwinia sp. CPCC 100877]|nr:FUSC family protein [Erwinia sp. CPCC 100877]
MNLSGLAWRNTPWGKATAGQWRYALRNSIAMCLALSIAYALELDQPYWAMTSAAVVSFPTVGGVISKSLGRIVGSIIGATASLIIAGHTLNDPWLFTFAMAAWLAICTRISCQYQNNVAYAFALAGYTAAIIAFPMVNTLETTELWDIAQARVCEVIIGILCGAFMMMVLPSTSDGEALLKALKSMHDRLPEHASMLWKPETSDAIRVAHESIISQILTMNLLRIQAFWSHYRFRQQNPLLNYLLHQQLRLTSIISSVRRMLLNWPDAPAHLWPQLETLLHELANPAISKYEIAQRLRKMMPESPDDYRHRAFWLRLRDFCWLWLNGRHWLWRLETATPVEPLNPPGAPSLARHADNAENNWSAFRTFCVITLTGAWCIATQWESGNVAMTLAAICCVLYSASPSPVGSVTLLLRTLGLLSLFSFMVKFGLMVQITGLWQFLIFLLPLLLTMQFFKLQHKKYAGLWGQLIVFMGSFISVTNPPEYDFANFLNTSLARVIGVALCWVAFSLLRPSSDQRKGRRHIRALRRGFIDQLSRRPQRSEGAFESLVYHHVSQLSNSKDEHSRRWLLRWGVVLLNCSHVVWQLREWEARSDPLSRVRDICITTLRDVMSERGIRQRSLTSALAELQRMCDTLSRHHNPAARDLAGIIWRLHGSLQQLEQAAPVDEAPPKAAS